MKKHIALITLLGIHASSAVIVIADPDEFVEGTFLYDAFDGVTIDNGNFTRPITATSGFDGTLEFGLSGVTGEFTFLDIPADLTLTDALLTNPGYVLRFEFDEATDYVALDIIANDDYDPASIAAYDASGNLIAYVTSDALNQTGVIQTLSISAPGIKTLLAGGYDGDNVDLDRLQYNLVPEPTTTTLAGIGLTALGIRRRRK